MLSQIQTILNNLAAAAVSLKNAKGAGRAFELLIMSELARELQTRGYSISFLRSDGVKQVPGTSKVTFIQRGGAPAGIRPSSHGMDGPTSIVFQRSATSLEWEIWNGVEFVGRSTGTHEFDLAIVPKALGDQLRVVGGRPFGHGWAFIECKDVSANGSLDEMRAFLARIYDTTLLNYHRRYLGAAGTLNRIHPHDPTQPGFGPLSFSYRMENMSVYHGIARRTGFTIGTDNMADYYFVRRFENVTASSPELQSLVLEVCDWLDVQLPGSL